MLAKGSSSITFKRALAHDSAKLLSWIRLYYSYDHIPYLEAELARGIPKLLGSDQFGQAYFVSVGANEVGYFIFTLGFDLEFGGVYATVTDLFFTEASRRSGAGTATLEFVERICLDHSIDTLILQVEVDNVKAQSFYDSFGFKKFNRYLLFKKFARGDS